MTKRLPSFVLATLVAISGMVQTDVTATYITNPSFETNGTSGWTVANMQTQTNSVFSRKAGSVYLESWVAIGQTLGDASVAQTLKNLPQGNYRLTAAALHIQQSASGSTTNKGAAQTGAYLFAGTSRQAVTAMKTYTLDFAVLTATANVAIGLVAEDATGNYLCVDNFRLLYMGDVTADSYVGELRNLVESGQAYLDQGIQESAAEPLRAAMAAAEAALAGTGTDAGGATTYDTAALTAAIAAMEDALKDAATSRQLYDALAERVAYAERVIGWWEATPSKSVRVEQLRTSLATAREKLTDYSLTTAQLRQAATSLDTRIGYVDKKIYYSTNACGTEAQLKSTTSQWSTSRSVQSKHWVLYWEAGYGTAVPAAVPGILATADRIFEFYADSLKFITINQNRSKSDTYKMIIRLRHTTEWEASGSGIDNQIGLLTLSNGAHTSRSGQTVAHEIGHCFQYQTHCDNNDWNGWMYNWGASTLNVFWEMCAQWQAYKFYPAMQMDNEWLNNTLNGLHRHPLCVDLRYNNYFIQDYFCHRHGMDAIGRLWNKSRNPEDPLQAYMRLFMDGTTAERLSQLGDEMWEYGARMATFDMDHLRSRGAALIGRRAQTALKQDADRYWWPTAADCIENWGNNAIRLNAPTADKTIYAEFEGRAGAEGYVSYRVANAGWRVGFVALQKDGTRLYGDVATVTGADGSAVVALDCPRGCSYVWLVVAGAPTAYWTRDWLSWSEEGQTEQWPYRVKFHQTNVYGKTNNNTYPTAIGDIMATATGAATAQPDGVYDLRGRRLRSGTSLDGLPRGIYLVGGRKVAK